MTDEMVVRPLLIAMEVRFTELGDECMSHTEYEEWMCCLMAYEPDSAEKEIRSLIIHDEDCQDLDERIYAFLLRRLDEARSKVG